MKYVDKNVLNHKFTKLLHQQPYRVCNKTIMDTSDINISFDIDVPILCRNIFLGL